MSTMREITKILRLPTGKDRYTFVGTLRNARRYNINDKVWFSVGYNEIAYGRIVGVELGLDDNPDYTYKIEVPKELCLHEPYTTRKCDRIFDSVDQAKESCMEFAKRQHEIMQNDIENYFKQF